ncbi:MAG TPA: helix-turn-helix domain-containing protein [Conexibacter sp.]|jgi:DNA-binding IclR family transcriptional regulator
MRRDRSTDRSRRAATARLAEPAVEQRDDGGSDGPAGSRLEVQSVRRAAQLLDALAADPGTATSALDLSRTTGLNRTVVHRLLRTLQADGLAVDAGNGRYRLGPKTVGLGMRYLDGLGIRSAALPYMISLNASLQSSPWIVTMAVRVGDYAVLVERLWKPEAPLESLMDIGTHMPLRTSAAGRCLLAYSGDDGVAEGSELAEQLEEVRASGGVEISSNELIPGMSAVAAAIVPRDAAVAAIIVSGIDLEPELSRDSDVAERLQRAAVGIAGVLR